MPKSSKFDLAATFASAGQSQQGRLAQRVKELEQEIERLRGEGKADTEQALSERIQELTAELAGAGGEHEVPLSKMRPYPNQPRTVFPLPEIRAFAEILKAEGQQDPVILIPDGDGNYFLFDGEFRWRSANLIGWETLKSVFRPQSEDEPCDEVIDKILSTNLHRHNLHSLDLARCLVQKIARQILHDLQIQLESPQVEIPRILNTVLKRFERDGSISQLTRLQSDSRDAQQQWLDGVAINPTEKTVLRIILAQQLNPSSVNKNIFPVLALPEDIQQIIRDTGIEGSKAFLLKQLSASTLNVTEEEAIAIRADVANQIVLEQISVPKVRALIAARLSNGDKSKPVHSAYKLLQKIQPDKITSRQELESLEAELVRKLESVRAVLKSKG